jgi:hypothetical protein
MKSFEIGTAQLTIRESETDPWAEVEVTKVLIAFYLVSDNTMQPGRVVAEVNPDEYLPYYYKMTDLYTGE